MIYRQRLFAHHGVPAGVLKSADWTGPVLTVNGGVKVGRVGGRLLSIGDQILYRPPSFIGL